MLHNCYETVSINYYNEGNEKDQKQLRLLDALKVDALLAQGKHEEALNVAEAALKRVTGTDYIAKYRKI